MMPVIYLHHFWFAGTDWAWFLLYRMYLQAASYQETSFPKWGNWWFLIYLFVPLCSFVTCVDRTACFFSGHSWLQSEDHRSLQSLWIKFLDYLLPCFSLLFFFFLLSKHVASCSEVLTNRSFLKYHIMVIEHTEFCKDFYHLHCTIFQFFLSNSNCILRCHLLLLRWSCNCVTTAQTTDCYHCSNMVKL